MKPKHYPWQQQSSDIPEQNMHGLIHSDVRHGDYKSTGRPVHRAPCIVRQFIGEDGEDWYELDNGRNAPANVFNSLWNPSRGTILSKSYMGSNPDKTRVV